jgi:hypothetical protein
MVRLSFIAKWGFALFASTIVASSPPHEGLVTERSPAPDNNAVSKAIDDALANAGLNATEAAKIRDVYHVGINQIDDSSDEWRKALDDALRKILDNADVKKIDDALDVLVGKLDGLVSRDVESNSDLKMPTFEDVVEAASHPPHSHHERLSPREARNLINPAEVTGNLIDKIQDGGDDQDLSEAAQRTLKAWIEKHRNDIKNLEKREEPIFHGNRGETYPYDPVRFPKGININNCDCKKAIESIVEPKPTPLTPEWLKIWTAKYWAGEEGGSDLMCIRGCADRAVSQFIDRVVLLEEIEEKNEELIELTDVSNSTVVKPTPSESPLSQKPEPLVPVAPGPRSGVETGTLRKREEATDHAGPESLESKEPLTQDKSSTFLNANYSDEEIAYSKDKLYFQPVWEKMMAILKAQGETPKDQVVPNKIFEEFKRLFANARKPSDRIVARDTVPPPNSEVFEGPKSRPRRSYRDWFTSAQKTGDFCTCELKEPSFWNSFEGLNNYSPRCRQFCKDSVEKWLETQRNGTVAEVPAPPHLPPPPKPFPWDELRPVPGSQPWRDTRPVWPNDDHKPQKDVPGTVSAPVTYEPQGYKNPNGQAQPGQDA